MATKESVPRRTKYHVLLKDLSEDHEYYWKPAIRLTIQEKLQAWFNGVITHSPQFKGAQAEVWWSSNALLLEEDELLVYFIPSVRHSIVKSVTGTVLPHGGGATMLSNNGMISEVHIESAAGDARIGQLLAVMAFHELMHNKLDADPQKSSVGADVHSMGHTGNSRTGAGDVPSEANKIAMGKALHVKIPQYKGHINPERRMLGKIST
jgi:hypothetical protein